MAPGKDSDEPQPIIIKRIKKGGGGHHGGAWKVAYADFVTAMMAFFLLLWLLSVTTDDQKLKIADYFSLTDPRISTNYGGADGVLAGTTIARAGARSSTSQSTGGGEGTATGNQDQQSPADKEAAEQDLQDKAAFEEAEKEIRAAIETNPELIELSENLMIDETAEGLRIQIVDSEGRSMFKLGSADPLPRTIEILKIVASTIEDLPNKISVRGHTDSVPYGKDAAYTNWELSSDRANASRRYLLEGGLDIMRLQNVQGRADKEHLVPTEPNSARNRRISIILLKQSLIAKVQKEKKTFEEKKIKKKKKVIKKPYTLGPKKREEGVIYFP